jgi:iron(II)-dependent oxidoreductase
MNQPPDPFTLSRRHLLGGAAAVTAGIAGSSLLPVTTAGAAGYPLTYDRQQMLGPATPADATAWRAAMKQWRDDEHARLQYDPAAYSRPELAWAQSNPIQPQVMVEDRFLFDVKTGEYTVDRYLADVRKRYGGIDSVLIWPTYPNIGADNRNTEDMFRAMPGGWAGVRGMVRDFHRAGVRVLFPIMVWDLGSRDPGKPWADILPQMMLDVRADGMNGDTMPYVTKDYFDNSIAAKWPLVFEPEGGLSREARIGLGWNTQSWGYWDPNQDVPRVSVTKWLEPRHTVHVCDRWSTSKIDFLQIAFFNGTGLESWENVWGIWMGLTDRDGEAIRRVATIERKFPELLVSSGWEPHTPTVRSTQVYASKWPAASGSQTLWTLVNRGTDDVTNDQLIVKHQPGLRYYDLWHGVELTPVVNGDKATLSFRIEANGFGAVLASRRQDLPRDFESFQTTMRSWARRPLSSFSAANTILSQKMTPSAPTRRLTKPPAGMVYVPGGRFPFVVSGTEIEGENRPGVDVQYPWETQPGRSHSHEVSITPFYIDRVATTNAQYKKFLDATGYRPKDRANFLKDWSWTNPKHPRYPSGWDGKPVTWVSLEDARAYAAWARRRLPQEWEWQYAAQGLDGRLYPWGNVWGAGRVPAIFSGRGTMQPPEDSDAHPEGASPFGVLDMVGNVWQWTDEFTDAHTRAAVVRGGSYYRALTSKWYFPSDENAYRLDRHNKYLLMAPGRDRAATIGFRTVVDAVS